MLFPDVFSIWATLPGSLFFLIGGGGAMAAAMIWTIVADVVPVAERTSTFFQLTAVTLIISVLVNPVSALLLKYDPWIAMWLSFGCLVVGMCSIGLIPETLTLRRKADARRHGQETEAHETQTDLVWRSSFKSVKEQVWSTITNDMKHIWGIVFASKNMVILVIATSAFLPMRLAVSNSLLQYMTKRFDWEWSTVSLCMLGCPITDRLGNLHFKCWKPCNRRIIADIPAHWVSPLDEAMPRPIA